MDGDVRSRECLPSGHHSPVAGRFVIDLVFLFANFEEVWCQSLIRFGSRPGRRRAVGRSSSAPLPALLRLAQTTST